MMLTPYRQQLSFKQTTSCLQEPLTAKAANAAHFIGLVPRRARYACHHMRDVVGGTDARGGYDDATGS